MISLRSACLDDAEDISQLLRELDYEIESSVVRSKIEQACNRDDSDIVVAVNRSGKVLGFVDIRYIPQIALEGDFSRISYFCVDSNHRSQRIGEQIEGYVEHQARQRKCDRIEVHCHHRREAAHRFYRRQGYSEAPIYFAKQIQLKSPFAG